MLNLRDKMTESKMSTQVASPRAVSQMHDWTSVNGWARSRPSTKEDSRSLGGQSGGSRSQLALRRCQTMMEKQQVYRPHRQQPQSDSCTIDFIKHLETLNKETATKLKDTSMHVLSIQRSRSDLDNSDATSSLISSLAATGLFREKSHMYLSDLQELARHREPVAQSNKQEMKIGLAVVPRKGLISLRTTETQMYNEQPHGLGISGIRRRPTGQMSDPVSVRSRSLIKRNHIIEHIKLGNKLLEDAEGNKDKGDGIGDYTIHDLQAKLIEMTEAASVRRQTTNISDLTSPPKRPTNVVKSVTFPDIYHYKPSTL